MAASKLDPFSENFDSLDEIADRISEVLHCPITIEDVNHRLLAYSTHDDRTDPARVATIMGRRVPEKVINSLWKNGVIPQLLNSRDPVRIKTVGEIGLGDRVAISVWKNDELLGFIWALEIGETLGEEGMNLLKRAAEATKNKLVQVQARKHKRDEQSHEFFWKLLTGHYHSNEEVRKHFQSLKMTPPSSYAVMVFMFSNDITRENERQVAYQLRTIQKPAVLVHTFDQQQLVMFISLEGDKNPIDTLNVFSEQFIYKMMDRYDIPHLVQGFSGIYSDYLQIEKAFREASKVLAIKHKFPAETEEIHCYQNLGIYKYLDFLLEKTTKSELGNPALKKLHEYDRKNHTDLAQTLEMYLNKDCNIQDTAKALNVHINTLNYRLKRLSEIGDINLKDPNQKVSLFVDIKLEKFQ
ncbi:PucR family transcriptional regulator [Bacillus sp. FJAT-27225]|uniref:PucR family transcriptional regulator n=1 Tax=Bacillus sp. FJAT-27225 TaxID=1743144 RepID=UPI00080C2392|nr:PucR family transcriptional regulator [Bacillus sp. FJAT-27225]OCA81625.1 PucR family transcriptional regulator [Bacillus sp. FJAT-27225]